MVLTKEQKKSLLEQLNDRFLRSKAAVFTNYQGLKVTDLNLLRGKLKEKGIDYKVVKNTLVKLALKEKGIAVEGEILDKPAAIAFGYDDEVEVNKIVYQFNKENEKLEILGAIVNGEFVSKDVVKSLALLPGREELHAKVVGSIAAPLRGFVSVLQGNLRGLVSILKQYQEKKF
ncbi:50S ribosomal protein L10 [Candidatus Berkelbacteria bacterium RIFCSPHIGHO2_12_FULL_36_9]|uniref:Large ribosomal subunit protein uL10 n=1 Tax=Candidatus Berkelbacteria bacterium RIFCSPHIGHO2_12_FULL_36_9 TaxID=1797469 RepID=A0A1F5EKE3_9BACT|nr:MAG: 50S ribosomal protein L10 [Candidatus Berkelbacteria bacterium RIFCSPHIGHO2_12_FULL_36_9]